MSLVELAAAVFREEIAAPVLGGALVRGHRDTVLAGGGALGEEVVTGVHQCAFPVEIEHAKTNAVRERRGARSRARAEDRRGKEESRSSPGRRQRGGSSSGLCAAAAPVACAQASIRRVPHKGLFRAVR